MTEYIDCYWLVDSRKSSLCHDFLNKFLPTREESAEDYPVPIFSDSPTHTFTDVNKLLDYLEKNESEDYSIYWNNLEETSVYKHAMVFHTDDGKMILGISLEGNSLHDKSTIGHFKELGEFLGGSIGCMKIDEVPPSNSQEFIEFCS